MCACLDIIILVTDTNTLYLVIGWVMFVCKVMHCLVWGLVNTCTGAMTAQGPPSNCSSAVCSVSLKTIPKIQESQSHLFCPTTDNV